MQTSTAKARWDQHDQTAAYAEGWGIFDHEGVFPEIQYTHDFPSPFLYDVDAVMHVTGLARRGSDLHRRAVAYLAQFWLDCAIGA